MTRGARFFKGDDGVWIKYWEHPDFVKVLQFANTLFNEQLVARTEFTEKQPQLWGNMLTKLFSELNGCDPVLWHNHAAASISAGCGGSESECRWSRA